MVLLELPSPGHPTTLASVGSIVPAKIDFVLRVSSQGTVDELLLRETHWGLASLNGSSAFQSSVGSKGPTGTAVALVLDGDHMAICVEVNISGSVDSEDLTSVIPVISQCGFLSVGRGLVEAEECLILSGFEVRCPVVTKDEDIGVATASCFAIMLCNDIIICVIPVLSLSE